MTQHSRSIHRKKCIVALSLPALLASQVACATDDASLTWNGITLYGVVDIGVAHEQHGAPLSQDMYTGLAYLITKNSNRSITSIAPNGLSQSKLGLKGTEGIADKLNFVFNLELGFNPESGRLSDALASLVHNNGVPQANQTTGADGSRAGQLFSGPAYVGLSSPALGTLTLGRHNTFLTDAVTRFDPLGASYAFSVLGASGTTAGGGNTQDVRLDDSMKYTYTWHNVHAGALYQFGHSDSSPGKAVQLDAGAELGGITLSLKKPHVFDLIKQAYPGSTVAVVADWANLTQGLLPTNADFVVRNDAKHSQQATDTVKEWLSWDNPPTAIFYYLHNVDIHACCYDPYNAVYQQKILDEDAQVKQVLDALTQRPGYAAEDWLIVVASDHGGLNTGHGGQSSSERDALLILNNTYGQPGKTPYCSGDLTGYPLTQVDGVTPHVLDFLGIPNTTAGHKLSVCGASP